MDEIPSISAQRLTAIKDIAQRGWKPLPHMHSQPILQAPAALAQPQGQNLRKTSLSRLLLNATIPILPSFQKNASTYSPDRSPLTPARSGFPALRPGGAASQPEVLAFSDNAVGPIMGRPSSGTIVSGNASAALVREADEQQVIFGL